MSDLERPLSERLPPLPKLATAPAFRYFKAFWELLQLRAIIGNWEWFVMNRWSEFEAALRSRPGFDEKNITGRTDRTVVTLKEQHSIKAHEAVLWGMLRCRAVDNLLVYLRDLLILIHRVRPETLKTARQVTVEFVLGHQTMEEFIRSVAEQRVEALTYQGSEKLFEFLDKLGIKAFHGENAAHHRKEVIKIIEERNILVHNRGMINEVFKKRVPWHPAALGTMLKGDILETYVTEIYLFYLVGQIDEQANDKFNLPFQKYPE